MLLMDTNFLQNSYCGGIENSATKCSEMAPPILLFLAASFFHYASIHVLKVLSHLFKARPSVELISISYNTKVTGMLQGRWSPKACSKGLLVLHVLLCNFQSNLHII
jgi:hypothetical protein